MYHKILIANRADCALRLIRACHAMNIRTVVTAARDDALPAIREYADEVMDTGFSRDAYTREDDILEAARLTGCEAVLPGWGFLSEECSFARRCRMMGIHFIGPKSQHLQAFGDKLKTLEILADTAGRPPHAVRCDAPALAGLIQTRLAPPVMLKGRFGGGGKQISLCTSLPALQEKLARLRETHALDQYYLEPAVTGASHIEFQCFGDGRGNVDILGIRDCTPQMNHQKWLEISLNPSDYPTLAQIRCRLKQRLAEIQYLGWGTVEFLITPNHDIHLLELNPRLQVEHGVTELAHGIDLVQSAIRLSCDGRMPKWDFKPFRQTVEFRLYARSTGTLKTIGFDGFPWPEHPTPDGCECRVESAFRAGDALNGVYDGMIARFILCSSNGHACDKIKAWLKTFTLAGIDHNLKDLYDFSDENFPFRDGQTNDGQSR